MRRPQFLLAFAVLPLSAALLAQVPYAPSAPKPEAKGKPAAAAPDAPAKKEEPKIDGLVLKRANGGFIGVTLNGLSLRLKFHDDKKKPAAPGVVRALARWRHPKEPSKEQRAILNPDGEGFSLVSLPQFRPPYVYEVRVTLILKDGAAEEGGEALVFRLADIPLPGASAPAAP